MVVEVEVRHKRIGKAWRKPRAILAGTGELLLSTLPDEHIVSTQIPQLIFRQFQLRPTPVPFWSIIIYLRAVQKALYNLTCVHE